MGPGRVSPTEHDCSNCSEKPVKNHGEELAAASDWSPCFPRFTVMEKQAEVQLGSSPKMDGGTEDKFVSL